MIIVVAGKVGNAFGFIKSKTEKLPFSKISTGKKVMLALGLSVIIESVFFLVIGSSIAAVDAGFLSDKSNFSVVENILKH